MASNSTFHKANGFLRLFAIFMGVCSIGLAAAKFRPTEFSDLIFLAACVFTTFVSFLHFFLTFLAACVKGPGKCFRITDFIFHFIGGILLLVSSVYMLMGAPKRGKQLDYRFTDTNQETLVRTTAGVLGMQTSFIYFVLSYLTMADRRLVYCTSNKRHREKGDGNDDEISERPEGHDQLEEETNGNSNKTVLFDRFTWRRILADDILEARILTLLLGLLNGVLIADSYQKGYDFEEYFFSMVVICFCLTFLSQSSYALHIIRLNETATSIIDVILQLFSSLSLLAGGTLMLGSVIQNNSFGYQYKSIERTSAALVGIFNGLIYCHIGMNVKRAHFQQNLKNEMNFGMDIPSSTAVVLGKGTKKLSSVNKNNPVDPSTDSATNEDPKQGCAESNRKTRGNTFSSPLKHQNQNQNTSSVKQSHPVNPMIRKSNLNRSLSPNLSPKAIRKKLDDVIQPVSPTASPSPISLRGRTRAQQQQQPQHQPQQKQPIKQTSINLVSLDHSSRISHYVSKSSERLERFREREKEFALKKQQRSQSASSDSSFISSKSSSKSVQSRRANQRANESREKSPWKNLPLERAMV